MSNEASYFAYQCTWYVAKTLSWVPGGLGNAYQWYQNAQVKGFSTGDTPAVGAVAVWGANSPGSGGMGHVAVVQSVNPDGSFVVSEANYLKSANTYGANDTDTRTVPSGGGTAFSGFIYSPSNVSQNMSELSYGTLEQLWTEAGGPPSAAATAAAIAIAESSGNPSNVQQNQPYATQGWGLWQITPGNSEASIGTDSQLLDPLTNARAAVAKFNAAGGSFNPWTTYTGGAYKKYLNGSNYSGTGGLNATQQSAASAGQAIFSVSLPVLGTVDLDGVVGTSAMTGGFILVAIGTLVVIATMLEGPLSEAAKMYGPVKAVSQMQTRAQRGRRQDESLQLRSAGLGLRTQTEARQSATESRRAAAQAEEQRRYESQAPERERRSAYDAAVRRANIRYHTARASAAETRTARR